MLKLGFWDKMKALEQLAKHHGLLAEKIDLNITLEISVRDRDGHALRPTRGLAGALKKTGAGTVGARPLPRLGSRGGRLSCAPATATACRRKF